jgi:tetratricopeptide (TPR) repeat protein
LGVADSLITRLAALPSVTVLSRSAVAEARSRKADLRALASELDATYLVDGTVQLAADQVRISLSLVLSDGSVAWAETVEGPFASIFSLQTRLASALGQAMSVQLSAADRASLAQQPTMSPEALAAYWRGRALLDRRDVPGNVAAAIASFESATRADPSYADAHAARGEALWALYLSSRDPEHARLAIVSGSEALRLEPGSAQVRYALALTLDGSGRPDEAVEELQRALVLRPTFEEARRRLAQILARQGHIDQAIAEFQKAIDLRPNSWANYSALGVSLVQAARYQEAVEAFSRVIELHPEGAIGHQQLGATYQMLGNHDAALDSYRKAIAIAPLPQAYSAMGALLHERGDYAGAVEAYDKAIELRPNSHVTHRNLGDAFRRLQRRRDAENAYRRAVTLVEAELEVNPTDAPSLAALAVYHAKLGDWTAARARCEEAERLAAGDTQVLYDAAVVYALQGRREGALSRLKRAVAAGYSPTVIAGDDDFEMLAGVPAFQQLIAPAAGAQEVK